MSNRQSAPEKRTALIEACRDLVLRGRSNRAGDAEDIAQDACVRALGLTQPEGVRDPVHYLMRIARNLFVDRQRSKRRETALFRSLGDAEPRMGSTVDPERILAGKQDLQCVLAAIENLPPRCREAFILHRFHGLSYAAISRRMVVSTGTVEKHIAQAMVRVTRSLQAAGDNMP